MLAAIVRVVPTKRVCLIAALCTVLALQRPADVHTQTASVNKLLLTIQQQDLAGVPVINRQIGFVSYNGTVGTFTEANLASGANVITLPTTVVLQVYVKNTHATNTVTVTLTPQGGASAITQVLGPGAIFAIWQTATASTYGLTALTLTASGANTTVEYFLGG